MEEWESRIESVELLWHDLHIPPGERNYWASLYCQEPTEENYEGLEHLIACLEKHHENTFLVRSAIHEREKSLAKLRNVEKLFAGARPPVRFIQTEIATVCEQVREATLGVVAAVVEWRSGLTRPQPFIWHNENYVLKMAEDLNEFINAVFAPYLPCFVVDNPLMILPRSRYERSADIASPRLPPRQSSPRAGGRAPVHRPSTAPRQRPMSAKSTKSNTSTRSMRTMGAAGRAALPSRSGHEPEALRRLLAAETIIKGEAKLMETLELEKRALLQRGLCLPLIAIEGHTDPIPVNPRSVAQGPTAWGTPGAAVRASTGTLVAGGFEGTGDVSGSEDASAMMSSRMGSDGPDEYDERIADEEKHAAAVRIQRIYRGRLGRQAAEKRRDTMMSERHQRMRASVAERDNEDMERLAMQRAKQARANAILMVQRRFRAYNAKSSVEKAEAEVALAKKAAEQAERVAAEERKRKAEEEAEAMAAEAVRKRAADAAVVIQSRYRAFRLRKTAASEEESKRLEAEAMERLRAEEAAALERQRAEVEEQRRALEEERARLREEAEQRERLAQELAAREKALAEERARDGAATSAHTTPRSTRRTERVQEAQRQRAAVLLQSTMRAKHARVQHQELVARREKAYKTNKSAAVIQARYRGIRAQKMRGEVRNRKQKVEEREEAAAVIQSRFRTIKYREEQEALLAEREAALQAEEEARQLAEEEAEAAAEEQRRHSDAEREREKMRKEEEERRRAEEEEERRRAQEAEVEEEPAPEEETSAALLSQQEAEQERARRKAAVRIQARYRADVIRAQFVADMEVAGQHKAATRIQSSYRGHAARKQLARRREEAMHAQAQRESAAATRIQANYRGHATRRRLLGAQRARVTSADDVEDAKAARRMAIRRIQSRYRAMVAAKDVAQRRMEVSMEMPLTYELNLDGHSERSTRESANMSQRESAVGSIIDHGDPIEEEVEENLRDVGGGVLKVRLVEAKNIPVSSGKGLVYPYAVMSVSANSGKEYDIPTFTSQRGKSSDPVWNEDCEFKIPGPEPVSDFTLKVSVYDRKKKSKKDQKVYKEIGSKMVGLNGLPEIGKAISMWLPLTGVELPAMSAADESQSMTIVMFHDAGSRSSPEEMKLLGSVTLDVRLLVLNSPIDAWITLDGAPPESQLRLELYHSAGKDEKKDGGDVEFITVCLKEAKGLVDVPGGTNPVCTLSSNGQVKESRRLKNTRNPVWDELFIFNVPAVLSDLKAAAVKVELTLLEAGGSRQPHGVAHVVPREAMEVEGSRPRGSPSVAPLDMAALNQGKKADGGERKAKPPRAANGGENGNGEEEREKPVFKINSVKNHVNKNGKDELLVTLKNMTDKEQSLKHSKLRVTAIDADGFPLEGTTAREVSQFSKRMIAPDAERKLRLPWPEDVPLGPVVVTLK